MIDQKDMLPENIAAISAEFHGSSDFGGIYRYHSDATGGFPGFWLLMVEAARAFTEAEHADQRARSGLDYEWLDAVLDFAGRLTGELVSDKDYHRATTTENLQRLAEKAIDYARWPANRR